MGVNGVGKSTNLAKVGMHRFGLWHVVGCLAPAIWLLQDCCLLGFSPAASPAPLLTHPLALARHTSSSLQVAYWLLQNGVKVMIAACDTFRSGAVEQLKTHCARLQVRSLE